MLVEIARNTSSFAKYLPRKISERRRGWASRAARVPLSRSRATVPDGEASPTRKATKPGGTLTKRNMPSSHQEDRSHLREFSLALVEPGANPPGAPPRVGRAATHEITKRSSSSPIDPYSQNLRESQCISYRTTDRRRPPSPSLLPWALGGKPAWGTMVPGTPAVDGTVLTREPKVSMRLPTGHVPARAATTAAPLRRTRRKK